MKIALAILAFMCLIVMTTTRSFVGGPIAGGITQQKNFLNQESFKKLDSWVRQQKPELANARAIAYSTQVVAGSMSTITYDTPTRIYTVNVWSKPWEKFQKITRFSYRNK